MENNNINSINSRIHRFSGFNNASAPYKKIRFLLTLTIVLIALAYWYVQQNKITKNSERYLAKP